jgi:hypothetical protein
MVQCRGRRLGVERQSLRVSSCCSALFSRFAHGNSSTHLVSVRMVQLPSEDPAAARALLPQRRPVPERLVRVHRRVPGEYSFRLLRCCSSFVPPALLFALQSCFESCVCFVHMLLGPALWFALCLILDLHPSSPWSGFRGWLAFVQIVSDSWPSLFAIRWDNRARGATRRS